MMGFILLLIPARAQDASINKENFLDNNDNEDLSELAKYDKTVKKLRLKDSYTEDEIVVPKEDNSIGFGYIFTGLLYVLIIGLIIFILYMIFSSIKIEKKINTKESPEIIEIEDIEVIDTESGLDIALKAENYREAVRMLFIKLLQVLVQEKSIEWKPEKTNRDYLKEMKHHTKAEHFNNLVIAYDRIWYGSETIDKLFFDYLRADFEKFYSTENVNLDVQE